MAEGDLDPGRASGNDKHVFVCAAFNVKTSALAAFYESACKLVAHSRADAGCLRFDLQRELNWA
eukprot:4653827-Amphidinium_carterae.1